MKENEYEAFLNDHGDYMLRIHLSRVLGGLEPFNNLPGLSSIGYGYFGGLALAEAIAEPDVNRALENLINAGKEIHKYRGKSEEFFNRVTANGVVVNMGGMAQAPFDIISDFLRGMHGTMMDMFRQPDKLLEAVDFICTDIVERAIPIMAGMSNPRLFMPLHRGSDGFMSLKDFERFYWPSLKKVIVKAVDVGLIPSVFFEGIWDDRLEYMLELPKGKVVCHFDATNLFKAKDVLKGHLCIKGNVPASILQTGSIPDVQEYCKQLIDVVGKGGGYIMCNRSALDEAKMENLKAMIDFTHEYGIYA
jgi:uroporphyrinogen-III decarboxylase